MPPFSLLTVYVVSGTPAIQCSLSSDVRAGAPDRAQDETAGISATIRVRARSSSMLAALSCTGPDQSAEYYRFKTQEA